MRIFRRINLVFSGLPLSWPLRLFAVLVSLGVLAGSRIATAQPAISMERDPVSGKTRTFLAGQVGVPQDWNDSDYAIDNNVLACSLAPGLKGGQAIAMQGADDQAWSVQTTSIQGNDKIARYPIFAMVKASGEKDMRIILPGHCKIKTAIKAGTVVQSGAKPSYHIEARRTIEAGEVIPVLRIAQQSFLSTEEAHGANSAKDPQPLLTIFASGDNQRSMLEVWRMEQLRSRNQ